MLKIYSKKYNLISLAMRFPLLILISSSQINVMRDAIVVEVSKNLFSCMRDLKIDFSVLVC